MTVVLRRALLNTRKEDNMNILKSKLQPFDSERIYWAVEQAEQVAGDIDTLHLDDNSFYIKSKVDAAIAELESELKAIRSGEIYNMIEYDDCYRTDELYYPKEEVDNQIKSMEKHLKKAIRRLAELRVKYKKLRAVCVDAKQDYAKFVKSLEEFRI